MRDFNEVWIRGTQDMNQTLQALLRSGYEVRVRIDQESENITGTPAYLLSFVDPHFSEYYFAAVNEDGQVLKETDED